MHQQIYSIVPDSVHMQHIKTTIYSIPPQCNTQLPTILCNSSLHRFIIVQLPKCNSACLHLSLHRFPILHLPNAMQLACISHCTDLQYCIDQTAIQLAAIPHCTDFQYCIGQTAIQLACISHCTFTSERRSSLRNRLRHMVLHSSQNADQPFSQCSVDLASPDAGPPRARSCLRRPQVLGGPCLALQLLWPSSRMHARVPLTSGDGSHDPARCSDRDRALHASPSSMYLGRCDSPRMLTLAL